MGTFREDVISLYLCAYTLWHLMSPASDLWMRSGCGQSPSWTSSSAWTRWRNLSERQPPCYPVCRMFPWTKHLLCTTDGKQSLLFCPQCVPPRWPEVPPTCQRCGWTSQQAAILLLNFIYSGRDCSEHACFQHSPAKCVQWQYIQKSTVSSYWRSQCCKSLCWKRRKHFS